MRKVSRLVIASLFLQFFVGGVSAEAASAPLRINSVTVSGIVATVKWNPVKLTSKDFFEVEFSKTSTAKTYKVIKTKSSAIVAKLDPFTQIGTPIEIVKSFGGRDKYLEAVQKLETALYATSA
jgi:hypothetical protein